MRKIDYEIDTTAIYLYRPKLSSISFFSNRTFFIECNKFSFTMKLLNSCYLDYRLIRNANGLTTIRLISHQQQHNESSYQQQQQQQAHQHHQKLEEYNNSINTAINNNIKLEDSIMATDLRKLD